MAHVQRKDMGSIVSGMNLHGTRRIRDPQPNPHFILALSLKLGIGTRWVEKGLMTGTDRTDCKYEEFSAASAAYRNLSTCFDSILLETGFMSPDPPDPTKDCRFWSEFCYFNELMTPVVNTDILPNPLSILTVGTLEDLGYGVNYDAADFFNADLWDQSCVCANPRLESPAVSIKRPQLQEKNAKARADAVAYGKGRLAEYAATKRSEEEAVDTKRADASAISIAYLDNGVVRSIIVTPDS
jgi:hypothetical protein